MSRAPEEAWKPADMNGGNWDLATAAHLHRRAGFGASWQQLQRDVDSGFESSLQRVLHGESHAPDGRSPEEVDEIAAIMGNTAKRRNRIDAVQRMWLFRLIYSPHPLLEKLTLFWHGHYAVSQDKVNNPEWLLAYYRMLRKSCRGPMSELHLSVLRDASMLRWLDGLRSSKERPNENLAREFFELFALGEGAYTERDIQETARALTGWESRFSDGSEAAVFIETNHDGTDKTVFGQTLKARDEDIVRLTLARPEASLHVARKLFGWFVSNTTVPANELLAPLARAMVRGSDIDVAAGIETVLRSRIFFDPSNRGTSVRSPIEFIVGAIRGTAAFRPAPPLTRVTTHSKRMGQALFFPPSVAGWPQGLQWLNERTLIARANFAAFCGNLPSLENIPQDVDDQALATVLWGVTPTEARVAEWPTAGAKRNRSGLVTWLLSQPEAQVA